MRWVLWVLASVAGLAVLVLIAGWLVLASPMLAGPRGELTANYLQRALNQDIDIAGGVEIEIGPELHISAADLTLHSRSMPDQQLAHVGAVSFDVAVRDLLAGRFDPSDIQITAPELTLVVAQDGTTSWGGAPASGDSVRTPPDIAGFLGGHRLRTSDARVSYRDARNGLEFDLALKTADLGRTDPSQPINLHGEGTLNGEPLTLAGDFPAGQPFKITAGLSDMSVQLDGTPGEKGVSADLNVDIADLGQLLDVLKLKGELTGTGKITAKIDRSGGTDTGKGSGEALFTLSTGETLHLTGSIADLTKPKDISIKTDIQLYPEDGKPAPTTSRRDLKLVGVEMDLISRPGQPPLRSMVIETNGFVLDTGGEGPPPIQVSQIARTADGRLRLGKAVIRIGPPAAPFFIVDGSVDDVLHLEGFDFTGTLDSPAANLIDPDLGAAGAAFGNLAGKLHLTGNAVELKADALDLATTGTTLWDLAVTGSVENVYKFESVDLDIKAKVPESADFLTALQLDPVHTGPLSTEVMLRSKGEQWKSTARLAADSSELMLDLELDADRDSPVVRGSATSDLIRMDQVRGVIDLVVQFRKLDGRRDDTPEPKDAPFKQVTLQPLGQGVLLAGMDLEIEVDLKKIEGQRGLTSLKTAFAIKQENLSLGPLKFSYGGGHFDVTAAVDLGKSPDVLAIKGATSGWDFNHLLQELKFKKGASGKLRADFDLSGRHASVKSFLGSMAGWATVSMRDGSIDTQLLDVAGLGVLPWLFSKHQGKSATIVCLRAPLQLSNGRVTAKNAVVETGQVQLVVQGDVNIRKGTLDVAGQPRRIGKPLSRSPWPFTATGALAKPKIKVGDGPRKLRRADGASTMPRRRKLCVPDILQLK